jgi:hypothetical protein
MMMFLRLSECLDTLLQSIDDLELRSAVWHLHGYWYQQCSGVVYGAMSTVIDTFRQWVPTKELARTRADSRARQQTLGSLSQHLLALKRLTTSFYRFPLEVRCLSALAATSSASEHAYWFDAQQQLAALKVPPAGRRLRPRNAARN